jgi:hypothetical protein
MMRYLFFLSLLPFLSFAQIEVHSVFDFRDLQVRTLEVIGQGTVKYLYQDGRIITQSALNGGNQEKHYYYGAYDQLDSVQTKQHGKPVATTVYHYHPNGQLISTRSGSYPYREKVELDSFFYNPTGQLLSRKSYSNQLGADYGYRQSNELLLRKEETYTYDEQGRLLSALTTGWVVPSETFHTYDSQGRLASSEEIFNANDNQEEAGDRLRIHYEYTYDDHGLVTKIVVNKYVIKPNGREISLPGRQRFRKRYTFYGGAL